MTSIVGAPQRGCRCLRSGLAALGLVVVALGLMAPPAAAHAAFVSSEPGPGSRRASTPGVVVLRFSEPLIAKLSGASVDAPGGQRFQGRATAGSEIRVQVVTNSPGIYSVEWRTVSPVDGHTLRGRFRFGVGVDPGGGEEGETGVAPGGTDLLLAGARGIEYAALLLAVGLLVLQALAARAPPLSWVRLRPQRAVRVALAAGVVVVAGEAALAASTPSLSAVSAYLSSPQGGWRLARLGAEAVAALAPGRPRLLALSLAGALGGLAGAGHAAAVSPAWWGVAVDAGHLAAAGGWAGGILGLAVVRPPGGWRGPAGGELLRRFSPVAVPAFLATVGLGTLRGAQELASLSDLVGSSYGRVLVIKVAVVGAMVPLSVRAWRRVVHSPRAEAALAVGAVAAAAVLAAYPLPPGRAAEAEEAPAPTASSALPRAGDLTLGANAGDVLVGLTLRPARPGRNQLLLHLVPLGGEEDAKTLRPTLFVDGQPRELRTCGPPCRQADAELAGQERVEVRFPNGDAAAFVLPALPAGDGSSLLETLTERMNRLRSYHLDEVLTPSVPPLRATYDFVIPDRMHLGLSTGSETVRIGTTFWSRPSPRAPWEVSEGPPLRLPAHIWAQEDRRAATILGAETVDGTTTQILALFADVNGSPIWYRVWVDADGLVHRAEMRARGHFMDHRYTQFDAPTDIRPPT